jgi:2-furoyl-CoA dehydrogenase large subunit
VEYAAVDDSGTLINPVIVEGQVHGAAAQGIGSVLQENFKYSEEGELLNTNYYDYLPVTSMDVPHFKTAQIQSPSPFTVTGAKGMGEGGGCAQCTVTNAIQDAVWGYSRGIVTDLYNPSERVYSLLHDPQTSRAGLHVTRRRATSGRI